MNKPKLTRAGTKRNYKQGRFKPTNPKKYRGDPTKIVFRSSWEFKLLRRFDKAPEILEYGSEEVVIPYKSPADGNWHRYFVDFYVKVKQRDGSIVEMLLEVKPLAQTKVPMKTQGKTQAKFLQEVMEYGVNQAKWQAAEAYAKKKGWTFKVLTEGDIAAGYDA